MTKEERRYNYLLLCRSLGTMRDTNKAEREAARMEMERAYLEEEEKEGQSR